LDQVAFEQLVLEYASPAAAVANQILGDWALAEDAVQEAFIRVIRKRNQYIESHPFSSWFYAILRHVCIDMLRKRRRDQALVKGLCDRVMLSVHSGPSVDREVLLSVLPSSERSVLELRVVHSMPFREIAAALGISEEAAKKRAQRGLRKLRRRFSPSGLVRREIVGPVRATG
jgi:RNA polymerase sigma-70 factor (ECF subfamily)